MLSALLHRSEQGRISELVPVGQEFEVHGEFAWVTVPDGTTIHDTYNFKDGTITKWDPLKTPGIEQAHLIARTLGYGTIGDQLGMLYDELMTNGTISNTGPWATHISNIKTMVPKGDPATAIAWMQRFGQQVSGNVTPI